MGEFTQLYKKNFKIWGRRKCGWLCDIITTVVFALFLYLIASLSESKTQKPTSYLDKTFQIGPVLPTTEVPFPDNHKKKFEELKMNQFIGSEFMKNCSKKNEFDQEDRSKYGFVALAPSSNKIIQKLETFFETALGFKVKTYASLKEIQDSVTKDGYGGLINGVEGDYNQICMGVAFEETQSNKWEYNVIFNVTGNPEFHDVLSFDEPQLVKFEYESKDTWNRQIKSGLAYLMNFIDTEILKISTNEDNAIINTKLTYMPTPEFKKSNLYANSNNGDISNYIAFSVMLVFLGFVYNVLREKENRIAQNLSNMGMSLTNYYLSWILFYITVLFLLSFIWLMIVKFTFFKDGNIIMIWLLYFMTGLSFIGYGMLIISLFEKSKPGTLCAIVTYFVLYGVNITMSSMGSETVGQNTWFSLSPVAALAKAGSIATLVQSYHQPFDFALWNTELLYYKFSIFFYMTLGQFLVFSFLGIYLDQVLPKQTSVRRHPLFCFMKRKSGTKDNKVAQNQKSVFSKDDFEDVDEGLKAQSKNNKTLEIQNLRKVYPNGKVAVENLNLEMYSDQIFALLGHNGAGKTTTISMVSGLLPISSGKIKILGYDSLEDQQKVKGIMGVCPQKNPIYDSLTCKEHLVLYANVKKAKLTAQELEKEIDTILKDIDLFDKKNFPAGKLSGGQKRKLCVACAFIGGSKVILLDEPTSGLDVAARRHLWEMLKKYKKDRIIILTTHYMDEADFLGDRIGVMGSGKLLTCGSSLFLKNRFGVGYSLTLVKSSSDVSTEKISETIFEKIEGAELEDDISKEIKFILPTSQLDKFEELFQILETESQNLGIESFGVSLTTLEDVFLKIAEKLGKEEEEDLEKKISKINTIMEDDETDNVELKEIRVPDSQIFGMHFKALIKKRMIYFKKDLKGLICEIVIPILFVFLGILLTLIQIIREPIGGYYEPNLIGFKPDLWINSGHSSISGKISTDQLTLETITASSLSGFDTELKDKFKPERMFASYIEKADDATKTYTYTLFSNTTAGSSGIIGMNLMDSAILKAATGDSSAGIKVKFSPLPLTDQIKSFESTVDGFLAVFLISLAYSFIPSSMVMFTVKERENNAKHQQIVSGVSLSAYWFSSFLIDMLKYLIVMIFTMIIIVIFDAEAFIEEGAAFMCILLLIGCGMSLISFTYLTSFMFKSPSSAQIFCFVFSLFTGFILMIATVIFRIIESTRDYSTDFQEWVFSFLPMYQLCFGLYSLVTRKVWEIIFKLDGTPAVWSRWSALPHLIYSLVMTIIHFVLIFYIETKKGKASKENSGYQFVDKKKVEQDEDVIKEANDVKNGKDYTIKVQGMSKVYTMLNSSGKCCSKKMLSRKAAVKNISFGVKKGGCFGLLGTNGAGKTSTFKVLSGEIQPTAGFAEIAGMNVATDMKKIRSLIGYCPQFDALLERMTTREHLEMYAAIKGIPVKYRKKMISKMIKQLNLTKYENVEAGTYSGGNKRKLSVAIALLGNPPIVFLDEPSSGMDPEARRFMWTVVGNITSKRKMSSVVLTTHSMEEAEALSTKLAIMVEGRVKCIGPVQALKNKYGKGFEIDTKLKIPTDGEIEELVKKANISSHNDMLTMEQIQRALGALQESVLVNEIKEHGTASYIHNELKNKNMVSAALLMEFVHINKRVKDLREFMESTFGKISIIEAYQSFVKWKVEDSVKLSQLFGEMQRNKEKLNLSQYSVKQTSIEQIFIKFANEREPDLDE